MTILAARSKATEWGWSELSCSCVLPHGNWCQNEGDKTVSAESGFSLVGKIISLEVAFIQFCPRPIIMKGMNHLIKDTPGTSLAVQWLRLCLPVQGVWVQSLVGELRSHMPHSQKYQSIEQKQYCNKFNKDFKNGPHQKKKNLKKKRTPQFLS